MIFSKYKICHLDLSADNVLTDFVTPVAYYCVFWFKSVPLGERYINRRESVAGDLFWNECLNAIWPALQHYHKLQRVGEPLQKPAVPDEHNIKALCTSIIDGLHPEPIPGQCSVSVVICTRNRAGFLKNCLTHLSHQRCKPAEIIVVDNASATDETRQVAAQFSDVRYVREDRPGLDIARNRGAMEATGSIVAYTDDDTIPDPFWVYRVHETFEKKSVVAMTGLVIAASLETEAEVIFEKFWPFNRGYLTKIYDHHFFNDTLKTGPPVWEIGAGANMAFRKAIFEEVGYFDARLDVGAAGCSGDSELWYRILANGYAIEYNPRAVVQHSHRNSMRDLKKQLFCYMRGFTVAMLIQHQRFGHRGNLKHLLKVIPFYYLTLLTKGFPHYHFQYQTLFSEMKGIISGLFYYWRHRHTDPKIYE
jgi:glycosyltransferase involved in cell wall biosynthesis